MSLKSMGYDHPSYTARQAIWSSQLTGAAGVTDKFAVFANMLLFSITTNTVTAGTSTYTGGLTGGPTTVNPTTGVAVAATQLSLIRITNTASAGATVALSTTTTGPFTVGGSFLGAGGTATNQVGATNQFPLNTSAGTAAFGGIQINQGDQIYVVNGTDATSNVAVTIDYQILPLASVTA